MAGGNSDSSLYDGGYCYNETESSIKVYIKGCSKGESIVINGKNYLLQGDALIENNRPLYDNGRFNGRFFLT